MFLSSVFLSLPCFKEQEGGKQSGGGAGGLQGSHAAERHIPAVPVGAIWQRSPAKLAKLNQRLPMTPFGHHSHLPIPCQGHSRLWGRIRDTGVGKGGRLDSSDLENKPELVCPPGQGLRLLQNGWNRTQELKPRASRKPGTSVGSHEKLRELFVVFSNPGGFG